MKLFLQRNNQWQQADIDQKIYFTREIADIATFTSRADGSREIILPKTHRNASIFDFLGAASGQFLSQHYETLPARVFEGNTLLFGEGATLHVLSVQKDGYHCAIVSGNGNLMDALKSMDFTVLEDDPDQRTAVEQGVIGNFLDLRLLDMPYKKPTRTHISEYETQPLYHLNDAVNNAIRFFGYRLVGADIALDYTLTTCDVKRHPATIDKEIDIHHAVQTISALSETPVAHPYRAQDYFEGRDTFDEDNYLKAHFLYMRIGVRWTHDNIGGDTYVRVFVNGHGSIVHFRDGRHILDDTPELIDPTQPIISSGGSSMTELSGQITWYNAGIDLTDIVQTDGNTLSLTVNLSSMDFNDGEVMADVSFNLLVKHEGDAATWGEYVPVFYNSGYKNAYELLTAWLQLNAFFMEVDETTKIVRVFTLKEVVQNRCNAYNWTDKIVETKDLRLRMDGFASFNHISLLANELLDGYQIKISIITQGTEKGVRDYFTIHALSGSRKILPFHETITEYDSDGNIVSVAKKRKALPAPYVLLETQKDGLMCISDKKLDLIYEDFKNAIRYPVIAEAVFRLTPQEVKEFNHRIPVYLNTRAAYFFVQSITDYDGAFATVKMWKV